MIVIILGVTSRILSKNNFVQASEELQQAAECHRGRPAARQSSPHGTVSLQVIISSGYYYACVLPLLEKCGDFACSLPLLQPPRG